MRKSTLSKEECFSFCSVCLKPSEHKWCSLRCFCKDEGHEWEFIEGENIFICSRCGEIGRAENGN